MIKISYYNIYILGSSIKFNLAGLFLTEFHLDIIIIYY